MTDDELRPGLVKAVINDRQEKVDQVVQPSLDRMTAREEAYTRIVTMMKASIEAYLLQHPDRAVDQRSKDAEKESLDGLTKIFAILDEYLISYRPKGELESPPAKSPVTEEGHDAVK